MRMRNMKWLGSVLPLLLIVMLPGFAEKVATLPKPTGYVDDYANVISPATAAEMEAVCVEVHDKTKAQVFIVTVKTLDDEPIDSFANELYRKWKIGEKKTNRGVLLLFAIGDRQRRIEVGYGLEPILNDARAGDIGREMVPELQAAHYDNAISIGLREVAEIIAADAGVTLDTLKPPEPPPETDTGPVPVDNTPPSPRFPHFMKIAIGFFICVFASVVLFIVWFIIQSTRGGTGKKRSHSSSNSNSSSDDDSSSSSSSDSSSGSSDSSFSGGDGGDSGGGGASGSW